MITARENHPYVGRPDLHLFEPTLECFKHQTLSDFEWIIVDDLYEQRRNYFENMDLPCQIKHIPAKPNLWREKQFPAMATQYNKGIIYADGELLFLAGDSYMVLESFMANLWTRYQEGYFPLAWYFFDETFGKAIPSHTIELFGGTAQQLFDIAYPEQNAKCSISYNVLGYSGETVTFEHRYVQAFEGNNRQVHPTSWGWWFGCSSVSLEAMLQINGFDQKFDGDCTLFDCDVGSRLEISGYKLRFALFRDIFLIRATTKPSGCNPRTATKKPVTIKCNQPLLWFNREFKRCKANIESLTDKDIDWIKNLFCKDKCQLREECAKDYPWQYPFEHKSSPKHPHSSTSNKRWFNFWKSHQGLIDLTEERELRLSGDKKYAEGTFYD